MIKVQEGDIRGGGLPEQQQESERPRHRGGSGSPQVGGVLRRREAWKLGSLPGEAERCSEGSCRLGGLEGLNRARLSGQSLPQREQPDRWGQPR